MTLESAWIYEIHHFQLKFVSIYRKEVKIIALTYFLATLPILATKIAIIVVIIVVGDGGSCGGGVRYGYGVDGGEGGSGAVGKCQPLQVMQPLWGYDDLLYTYAYHKFCLTSTH